MKTIKKVLFVAVLLLLVSCRTTKIVYTVNGTTVIGVWEE